MCVVVEGRQTTPDRWLSPLVTKIRTDSWVELKNTQGSKSNESQAHLCIPMPYIWRRNVSDTCTLSS